MFNKSGAQPNGAPGTEFQRSLPILLRTFYEIGGSYSTSILCKYSKLSTDNFLDYFGVLLFFPRISVFNNLI